MRYATLFTLLFALTSPAALAADPPRPNVLLIMTDDQGFGDIASHGNQQIDTPALDALAAAGARFDRFYVSPVCAPTRAALLTGRYHPRTGVHGVTRAAETMRADEVTIAELLKQAGYATGIFGKWHNGAHYPHHPNGQGFDEFVGFCAGHWNNYVDADLEHNGTPIKTQGYITDVLTDRALDFIDAHKDGPWFCYMPYNVPHTPWQVPDKYWEKYKQRIPNDLEAACAYAMVENVDDNVKRLLDKIDALGLTENTIVIFTTDNGANSDRYNAGMKGRKGSLHEGGTRVPLFVRYPAQVKPRTVIGPIAAHIDLLPTIAQWCGVSTDSTKPLDGASLVPLLELTGDPWPDRTLFTEYRQRVGVRTQRWRAVRENNKKWQLYDMVADPGQAKNVADAHPEVAAQLAAEGEAWLADVSAAGFDPIPTEVGHAEAPRVTLPGHEALLTGKPDGISYFGRAGWAHDWVTNWTDPDAFPRWPIQVVRPGKYRVTLEYGVAPDDAGARIRIAAADASLDATVKPAHVPVRLDTPDRINRKEVGMMTWQTLDAGVLTLPAGQHDLTVKPLTKPGQHVMQLKSVTLERVE